MIRLIGFNDRLVPDIKIRNVSVNLLKSRICITYLMLRSLLILYVRFLLHIGEGLLIAFRVLVQHSYSTFASRKAERAGASTAIKDSLKQELKQEVSSNTNLKPLSIRCRNPTVPEAELTTLRTSAGGFKKLKPETIIVIKEFLTRRSVITAVVSVLIILGTTGLSPAQSILLHLLIGWVDYVTLPFSSIFDSSMALIPSHSG